MHTKIKRRCGAAWRRCKRLQNCEYYDVECEKGPGSTHSARCNWQVHQQLGLKYVQTSNAHLLRPVTQWLCAA